MSQPVAGDMSAADRFQTLWRRCSMQAVADQSTAIHQRLLDAYAEPQRFYHTLDHIEHCLARFDECRSLLQNPDAVEISIWFHDVIYEPGAKDNEARSARLYRELADGVHAPELCELVDRLIMATLHMGKHLADADASYMVDIDLSSFGLDWAGFLRDSRNLRLENPQLSDEQYFRNQGHFQSCLLARPRFFNSNFFYQRYEQQARDNLARYFAETPRPD